LRRVNNDRRFTLQDLMCDMPDHEVLKLRYLAVQQSLWEKNVDGNAEVLLDLKHLQKLTLVVERSSRSSKTLMVPSLILLMIYPLDPSGLMRQKII
jgi:hypothetical protein